MIHEKNIPVLKFRAVHLRTAQIGNCKKIHLNEVRTDWIYLLITPKFMLMQCALLLLP
jgi:hypothetical protein